MKGNILKMQTHLCETPAAASVTDSNVDYQLPLGESLLAVQFLAFSFFSTHKVGRLVALR